MTRAPDATLSSCAAVTALVSCLLVISVTSAQAQPAGFIYDESKVPPYQLPDPLTLANGRPVRDAETWSKRRRPEILRLFEEHIYGRAPGKPGSLHFRLLSKDDQALGGKAVRKLIAIDFTADENGPSMEMLLYLPRKAESPPPVFLGLNFSGNHSIHTDPGIPLSTAWMRDKPDEGIVDHKATERSRGVKASRWQVETILDRGYALATIYYGDIDPDFDDGFRNGVHPLFLRPGQTKPGPGEWGAWGHSRGLDYLESDRQSTPSG